MQSYPPPSQKQSEGLFDPTSTTLVNHKIYGPPTRQTSYPYPVAEQASVVGRSSPPHILLVGRGTAPVPPKYSTQFKRPAPLNLSKSVSRRSHSIDTACTDPLSGFPIAKRLTNFSNSSCNSLVADRSTSDHSHQPIYSKKAHRRSMPENTRVLSSRNADEWLRRH